MKETESEEEGMDKLVETMETLTKEETPKRKKNKKEKEQKGERTKAKRTHISKKRKKGKEDERENKNRLRVFFTISFTKSLTVIPGCNPHRLALVL